MNKSSFEQNGGSYRTVGNYRIPNIALPAKASKPLSVWGLKRKDYLMKHKRVQFNIMLMNGTLWTHLAEVDEQAADMFSRLVERMKVNEGITEHLKAENQMEWVARMNNIKVRATETINSEFIYTQNEAGSPFRRASFIVSFIYIYAYQVSHRLESRLYTSHQQSFDIASINRHYPRQIYEQYQKSFRFVSKDSL